MTGAAARDVLLAFSASQLIVFAASLVGAWMLPQGPFQEAAHPFGSWPLAAAFDHLFSPMLRGDATVYVGIPTHGYNWKPLAVYFPGYSVLILVLGGFASVGAATLAGYAISLASFLGALWVLHRLVTLDFGRNVARAAVLLIAFFPWAHFFSAPRSESLFLLLTTGAVYAARTQRWAIAGLLAAAASGTRNSGVLLIIPLLLLYLYGPARASFSAIRTRDRLREAVRPRRRIRPNLLWLGLTPIGLVAYSIYLRQTLGDALAWSHYEADFGRTARAPWDGVFLALRAAWHALNGKVVDPMFGSAINQMFRVPALLDVGMLALVALCLVVCWRRLPVAYAAYTTVVVAGTLAVFDHNLTAEPLISFERYMVVVFPLFVALALICERRRLTHVVVPVSAVGLAVLSALFAAGYPYF